jgi:hypothetical protein
MSTHVRPRPAGVIELMALPSVKALATTGAKEIATAAPNFINVQSGRFSASYRVRRAQQQTNGDVVATAYSVEPFAHLIEWGSIHNAPQAPLRKAAEGTGLRTRLNPKAGE